MLHSRHSTIQLRHCIVIHTPVRLFIAVTCTAIYSGPCQRDPAAAVPTASWSVPTTAIMYVVNANEFKLVSDTNITRLIGSGRAVQDVFTVQKFKFINLLHFFNYLHILIDYESFLQRLV